MPAPLQVQERQSVAVEPPQPGSGDAATSVPSGSGRASYRGGATQAPAGIEKLSSEFSKMSFRRTRDENVHSRPANIAVNNKQGKKTRLFFLFYLYLKKKKTPHTQTHLDHFVSWDCRIYQLYLCRGILLLT